MGGSGFRRGLGNGDKLILVRVLGQNFPDKALCHKQMSVKFGSNSTRNMRCFVRVEGEPTVVV